MRLVGEVGREAPHRTWLRAITGRRCARRARLARRVRCWRDTVQAVCCPQRLHSPPIGSTRAAWPLAGDQGLVLSVLDVCNSAVSVVAPLYGGIVIGRLGVVSQPLVASAHYLALLLPTWVVVRVMERETLARAKEAKAE